MYSLKRLVWVAFVVVSVLLVGIILLGAYQYRLAGSYNKVISQNERALFHYMTIRETITEALISGSWKRLDTVIVDIEQLNRELTRLKDNRLVSAELKLALVDKIDLSGLAILTRQVMNSPEKVEQTKKLQEMLRYIFDHLIQYDRIIVGQARERFVNFQKVVIGALGFIISLASFSLVLLYRNTVSPLLNISAQMQSGELVAGGIVLQNPVAKEVVELADVIDILLRKSEGQTQLVNNDGSAELLLGEAINETTNRLNGMINYAQLLYDSTDQEESGQEQREMLQKIIDSGNAIADEWQKIK